MSPVRTRERRNFFFHKSENSDPFFFENVEILPGRCATACEGSLTQSVEHPACVPGRATCRRFESSSVEFFFFSTNLEILAAENGWFQITKTCVASLGRYSCKPGKRLAWDSKNMCRVSRRLFLRPGETLVLRGQLHASRLSKVIFATRGNARRGIATTVWLNW